MSCLVDKYANSLSRLHFQHFGLDAELEPVPTGTGALASRLTAHNTENALDVAIGLTEGTENKKLGEYKTCAETLARSVSQALWLILVKHTLPVTIQDMGLWETMLRVLYSGRSSWAKLGKTSMELKI